MVNKNNFFSHSHNFDGTKNAYKDKTNPKLAWQVTLSQVLERFYCSCSSAVFHIGSAASCASFGPVGARNW
jgi:hypothetical protein